MSRFEEFVEKNRLLFDSLDVMLPLACKVQELKSPVTDFGKSASKSIKLRNSGNDRYRLGDFEGALKSYSESIAFAPTNSEELALAFGNRSAALFQLSKYDLCLLDVNRALKLSFPERSKNKLLKRKEECWNVLQLEKANQMKILLVRNIRSLIRL